MANGANADTDALIGLENNIAVTAQACLQYMLGAHAVAGRQLTILADRCVEAHREVNRWGARLAAADEDDDIDAISWSLNQAQQELSTSLNSKSRADCAYEDFTSQYRRIQNLCGTRTQKARHVLRSKVDEIADYLALRPDGSSFYTGIDSEWTNVIPGAMSIKPGSKPGSIYDAEVQEMNATPAIQPAEWAKLSLWQRAQALQNVENSMALIQGRPAMSVIAVTMGENEYGNYDGSVIRVNVHHLRSLNVNDCVDMVLHEGRHAYQRYAIDHPSVHFSPVEVNNWSDNISNYRTASLYGYAAYFNQPVEADARNYASSILNRVYL